MVYAHSAPFSRPFPILRQIAEKHKIGEFSGLRSGKPAPSRHGTSRAPELCPAPIMPYPARLPLIITDRFPHTRGDLGRLQEDPFSRTSRWSTRSLPSLPAGECRPRTRRDDPHCCLPIHPDPVLRAILPNPFISSPWRCFPPARWISPESPLSYSIMGFMV
jgi:hypothetical protein